MQALHLEVFSAVLVLAPVHSQELRPEVCSAARDRVAVCFPEHPLTQLLQGAHHLAPAHLPEAYSAAQALVALLLWDLRAAFSAVHLQARACSQELLPEACLAVQVLVALRPRELLLEAFLAAWPLLKLQPQELARALPRMQPLASRSVTQVAVAYWVEVLSVAALQRSPQAAPYSEAAAATACSGVR